MKKSLVFIILVAVMLLAGCKKEDQMTNFIPTQAPEEDNDDADVTENADDKKQDEETSDASGKDTSDTSASEEESEAPTQAAVYVGQTTTKYVKLDEYDAVLNVRAKPSRDGEIVGFLVHTEKVRVIEIKDGWASIKYNDGIYYVSSDFLVDKRPDLLSHRQRHRRRRKHRRNADTGT
jgi:hypothetical protein